MKGGRVRRTHVSRMLLVAWLAKTGKVAVKCKRAQRKCGQSQPMRGCRRSEELMSGASVTLGHLVCVCVCVCVRVCVCMHACVRARALALVE